MENGQNLNLSPTLDPSEEAKNHSDIMIQRMKNRERQRRYRARKRLEANKEKSSIVNESTLEMQAIGISSSRVHCKRNWKRDARMAGSCRQQYLKSIGTVSPALKSTNASEAPFLASDVRSDYPSKVNDETPRVTASRRHWKAEARNQKPNGVASSSGHNLQSKTSHHD